MDRRLEAFRRGAARIGARNTGRRYSAELRALAIEYAQSRITSGEASRSVADELGVPAQTLAYWLSKVAGTNALIPVEIVRHESPVASSEGSVRVLLPEGIVIAGLTTDDAIRVVRGLR